MTRAWLALASGALGGAALLALALLAMRLPAVAPLISDARAAFGTVLALHVNLATYTWVFAFAAALWARPGVVDRAAFALAASGVALLAVSPLAKEATPILSNYVPVLDQPVFLAGLTLFWSGIALSALRPLWHAGPAGEVMPRAIPAASLCAFGVLAAGFAGLPADVPAAGRYEALFWGFGHVLQIALVLLLIRAWRALAQRAGAPLPRLRGVPEVLTCLALFPAAWIVWHYPVASTEYRDGFTQVMRWASWPGALGLGLLALMRLRRAGSVTQEVSSIRLALAGSVLLFTVGLAIGATIRPGTTLVPAHYHGTVGALTFALLAYAGVLTGSVGSRVLARATLAYGGGTALLILALAGMGLAGAPRKTPGMPAADSGFATILAAAGGAVAVAGALVCAALLLRALWLRGALLHPEAPPARRGTGRRDVRPVAILGTVASVVLGGTLLAYDGALSWPAAKAPGTSHAVLDPAGHAAQRRNAEVQTRFTQAAMMLHARQYEHAVSALHRLLELAPEMPEVHVNMGFAMLGLERPAAARDFFEGATALRPGQANAYYGLALSLARLGDVEGALGSMRTYVHLSPRDDPFAGKAAEAIAEWERKRRR